MTSTPADGATDWYALLDERFRNSGRKWRLREISLHLAAGLLLRCEPTGVFEVRTPWNAWKIAAHKEWVQWCQRTDRPIVTICGTLYRSATVELELPEHLEIPLGALAGMMRIARGGCPRKPCIIGGGSGVAGLRVRYIDAGLLGRSLYDYASEFAVRRAGYPRKESDCVSQTSP